MRKYKSSFWALVIITFTVLLASCGGVGDSDGNFACYYETRVTDGCDGYGFGDWEEECYSFNSDDYYITPEEVCDNVTSGGYYCEAGCCIDKEFRNVELTSGFCE